VYCVGHHIFLEGVTKAQLKFSSVSPYQVSDVYIQTPLFNNLLEIDMPLQYVRFIAYPLVVLLMVIFL
jgi:hypothetical protein